jgi:hypothetical protein
VTCHHLEAHCLVARIAGEVFAPSAQDIKPNAAKVIAGSSSINNNDNNTTTTNGTSKRNQQSSNKDQANVKFPYLTLLASGGHTSILLCQGVGEYMFLGGTVDDALGETFDKAARMLGLKCDGPSGQAVELAARRGKAAARGADRLHLTLKIPMREKTTCDFSYAGDVLESLCAMFECI